MAVKYAMLLKDKEYGTQIALEAVSSSSVGKSVEMTTHPIVDGTEVADHIYKQATTLSFNGSVGLNMSSAGSKFVDRSTGKLSLSIFQQYFETAMNEGHLFDILRIQTDENGNSRFLKRENMVLVSISWTENINSLDYAFDFKEALLVDVSDFGEGSTNTEYPDVVEPQLVNFSETLINWDEVNLALYNIMLDQNMIDKKLVEQTAAHGLLTYLSMMPIIGIYAMAANAILGIQQIFNKVNDQVKVYNQGKIVFKYYTKANGEPDDEKNKKEIERLSETFESLREYFKELDNYISVYKVNSNEAHKSIIFVDNEAYWFDFVYNNIDGNFHCEATDINNVQKGFNPSITSASRSLSGASSVDPLVKFDGGTINLIYVPKKENYGSGKYNAKVEDREDINYDLTDFYLVVYKGDINKYQERIEEIARRAIGR